MRLLVEPARVGQQAVARFAAIADALGNAREVRHQRGLPRIGQHERARVALGLEFARELAPAGEVELAVTERRFDDPADAAHARIDRRAPRTAPGCRRSDLRTDRAAAPTSGSDRIASPTQDGATIRMRSPAMCDRGSALAADRLRAPRCGHGVPARHVVSGRPCAALPRARSGFRNRGTSPRRSPRCRGTRADATTTAASPDWGRTRAGPRA